jgi:hypothetical protein
LRQRHVCVCVNNLLLAHLLRWSVRFGFQAEEVCMLSPRGMPACLA